jgi:beta-lactamase regulating signal transducer with metallopeptidase domain
MNSIIESLNVWGARFLDFALPILWQSSLLIAVVFAFDFLLQRKIRPAVRYLLWFVVFVKLLLPPTLALPTGAAWWLRAHDAPPVVQHAKTLTVNYSEPVAPFVPPPAAVFRALPPPAPPLAKLSRDGWVLLVAISISAFLAAWSLFRMRQVARCVRTTIAPNGELLATLAEVRCQAGLRRNVRLQLTSQAMSPAVCGLFRPVVLLPQSLVESLTAPQLRAVLLHELIHLRRGDVWVNCAQTLLQILYWWHPLLWLANARVRRVREEAVDDAVMCALNDEAEIYAPTLLEVAKLAFNRPLASLGLVGILESRNALRHRIERLLNFTTPRRAGISVISVLSIAAFTALAVPMGEPPARPFQAGNISDASDLIKYHAKVNPEVFMRNVKARAAETMHSTNDDLTDILASILESLGVDCSPPRNPTFNASTGEVTLQNTPEAMNLVDSAIRELNLPGGEKVLNPPYGLKQVLVVAQFYQMRAVDFSELHLDSSRLHEEREMSPWWELSTNELDNFREKISTVRAEHISSPRVHTSHGVAASLFIGDQTHGIEFQCVPYIHNGSISLTALARTTGDLAPEGGWPDLRGYTNCAIFSRFEIPDGGAVVLRGEPAGATAASDLVILLRANTAEPTRSKDKVPFLRDVPGVGHFFRSESTNAQSPKATEAATSQKAGTLLADGMSLYETGKLDEAEAKMNELLALYPNNQTALYYLSLIKGRQIDTRNIRSSASNSPIGTYRGSNGGIYNNPGRQQIYEKLTGITFDKISFPDKPLSEVIRELTKLTDEQRDPDEIGLNFLLNRGRRQTIDPKTGQLVAEDWPEGVDLASVKINLNPGLRNVRLLDVLEAIVQSSDHPITYSLLEYGIEFSFKGPDVQVLHTRTFKVDPNTFYAGLQNFNTIDFGSTAAGVGQTQTPRTPGSAGTTTGGGGSGVPGLNHIMRPASTTELYSTIMTFFTSIGVDLTAPKSVFFNDRLGKLTVHATDDDLELIEQAINTLNIAPPHVTIHVRFVEVNDRVDDLVEDRFLPNSLAKNADGGGIVVLDSGGMIFSDHARKPTDVGAVGLLTESQFRVVLRDMEKSGHGKVVCEREVTTLSGRKVNFQNTDVPTFTIGSSSNSSASAAATNAPPPTHISVSTALDIIPTVAADGYTFLMSLHPTATASFRHEDPKQFSRDPNFQGTQAPLSQPPLPQSRVREIITSARVSDGQTLVLRNLTGEIGVSGTNGMGSRQPYTDKKKHLIIFITPTIIDPSGNRVRSAEAENLLAK